jgi:hypothetical protein
MMIMIFINSTGIYVLITANKIDQNITVGSRGGLVKEVMGRSPPGPSIGE